MDKAISMGTNIDEEEMASPNCNTYSRAAEKLSEMTNIFFK